MKKSHYIGIDISKLSFDAAIYEEGGARKRENHKKFDNNEDGFKGLIRWLKERKMRKSDVFVCMEATGVYSLDICYFLEKKNVAYRVEDPRHLKNSMGLVRGKNDTVDSFRIAEYAYEKRDKLVPTRMKSDALHTLDQLLTERKKLVRDVAECAAELEDRTDIGKRDDHVTRRTRRRKEFLEQQLADIEKDLMNTVCLDEELHESYKLLCSIPGIGMVNAVNTIARTANFTAFDSPRKYASYIGVAPFEHLSGTSVNGRTHVIFGCRRLKADLTCAAKSAVQNDMEMKHYFDRKIAEGKAFGVVLNAVKFKMILRMFAVIKRRTPFVQVYRPV